MYQLAPAFSTYRYALYHYLGESSNPCIVPRPLWMQNANTSGACEVENRKQSLLTFAAAVEKAYLLRSLYGILEFVVQWTAT